MSFTRTITVRFDEADARGILFYGRLQELAHRLFEDFVASEIVGGWDDWFLSPDFIVPIRHAEATFHRPMRPGHSYQAELSVVRLGETSFDVRVRFRDSALCAETLVSHVFADAQRFRKIPIPSALRPRLQAHLASE